MKQDSTRGFPASSVAPATWAGVRWGDAARVVLRRQAVFLFAPLLYITAMLLHMSSIPLNVVPRIIARLVLGSVYRSPQLYVR